MDDVAGFLGAARSQTPAALPGGELDTAVRTILFTDIESSTALTQRLGDEASMDLIRFHDSVVRDALEAQRPGDQAHRRWHHVFLRRCLRRSAMRPRDPACARRACRTRSGDAVTGPHRPQLGGAGRGAQRSLRRLGSARPPSLRPGRARTDPCLPPSFASFASARTCHSTPWATGASRASTSRCPSLRCHGSQRASAG